MSGDDCGSGVWIFWPLNPLALGDVLHSPPKELGSREQNRSVNEYRGGPNDNQLGGG